MRTVEDLPFSHGRPSRAEPANALAAANENSLLSELQFLCAHTNKSIGTGVWTDNRTLALAKARGCTMRLDCPHCGMTHKVKMDEALLVRTLRWEDRAEWSSLDSLPVIAAARRAKAAMAVTVPARQHRASAMNMSASGGFEAEVAYRAPLPSAHPLI